MNPGPQKKQPKFFLKCKDEPMVELVKGMSKKTLAVRTIDCADRVLSYFVKNYPDDPCP